MTKPAKKRKRIPRKMMMMAAEICAENGVRVLLKPDGTIVIGGDSFAASKNEPVALPRPSPPDNYVPPPVALEHREMHLFETLANAGLGVPVSMLEVRNCGPATRRNLIERGYADPTDDPSEVVLTQKGLDDWGKLMQHRKGSPALRTRK